MSELRTFVCDICGEKIAPELVALDLGVWFNGGQIGIPHVCPACQEKTTIAECRRRLNLKGGHTPTPEELADRDHDRTMKRAAPQAVTLRPRVRGHVLPALLWSRARRSQSRRLAAPTLAIRAARDLL